MDPAKKMSFERIGDSWQIAVRSAEDLVFVKELDAAHWTVTSLPVDSIACDPEFLGFIDDDSNGRIRIDEVKRSVEWLLFMLKDYSGINEGSSVLKFSAINDSTADGKMILEAARLAMLNGGVKEPQEISLEDIRDQKRIMAAGLQNGDGVIPLAQVDDPDLAEFTQLAMDCCGKVADTSGSDGINADILNSFVTLASAYLKWFDESKGNSALLPYEGATSAIFALYQELSVKIDEYFMLCDGIRLAAGNTTKALPPLNIMDAAAVHQYLLSAPVCEPNVGSVLSLKSDLNPIWRTKLLSFFALVFPERTEVSLEQWDEVKGKLSVYEAWQKRKNTNALDKVAPERLRMFMTENFSGRLTAMIEADAARKDEIVYFKDVRKLILFQSCMIRFLNNYVTLKSLFDQKTTSLLLAGKLIMDGRHFMLTTRVVNVAEHKKIAMNSNICTMYLDVMTGRPGEQQKMTIAAAVTSGDMYTLFVGKSGVFFTPDGVAWDARVIDYIQQPVSFSEALKMPFYRFGMFIGKQIDKFFSARSKEFETGFEKTLAQSQSFTAKNPPPAANQQTPAVSGSMLLMGGGVGLAAIGSSIAFMAQAVKNVSIWNVLAVLLVVVLIFGGPVIIISLVKLYRRNVAGFLEAGGWALNKQMRLSRNMGRIFTDRPRLPRTTLMNPVDVVRSFMKYDDGVDDKVRMSWKGRFAWILISLAAGLCCGFVLWYYWLRFLL